MVLAFCHHGLGPKVMHQLLWSKGLSKDPAVVESPQPAHAPGGLARWGQCLPTSPDRTSPCTSPSPRDAPSQELISGQTFPLAERLKPLLAELNSRQDKNPCTHLKNVRKYLCSRNLSVPCQVFWWVHSPAPGARAAPAPLCSAEGAEWCRSQRNLRHHRVGPGEGEPPPGTMTVYSADHKPNPLWFLIGIWAKLI